MQYNEFGKFLKEKRTNLQPEVSLNKFAIDCGMESSALSRIENQKQGISLERLEQISNGYGILVSELVAEYEKQKRNI